MILDTNAISSLISGDPRLEEEIEHDDEADEPEDQETRDQPDADTARQRRDARQRGQ